MTDYRKDRDLSAIATVLLFVFSSVEFRYLVGKVSFVISLLVWLAIVGATLYLGVSRKDPLIAVITFVLGLVAYIAASVITLPDTTIWTIGTGVVSLLLLLYMIRRMLPERHPAVEYRPAARTRVR